MPLPDGECTIVDDGRGNALGGTITGKVVDAATKQPIALAAFITAGGHSLPTSVCDTM